MQWSALAVWNTGDVTTLYPHSLLMWRRDFWEINKSWVASRSCWCLRAGWSQYCVVKLRTYIHIYRRNSSQLPNSAVVPKRPLVAAKPPFAFDTARLLYSQSTFFLLFLWLNAMTRPQSKLTFLVWLAPHPPDYHFSSTSLRKPSLDLSWNKTSWLLDCDKWTVACQAKWTVF